MYGHCLRFTDMSAWTLILMKRMLVEYDIKPDMLFETLTPLSFSQAPIFGYDLST